MRSAGDRLGYAFFGSILGWVCWAVCYGLLMLILPGILGAQGQALRPACNSLHLLPPFWWGVALSLDFALLGSLLGEERMMDGVERVFRMLGDAGSETGDHTVGEDFESHHGRIAD